MTKDFAGSGSVSLVFLHKERMSRRVQVLAGSSVTQDGQYKARNGKGRRCILAFEASGDTERIGMASRVNHSTSSGSGQLNKHVTPTRYIDTVRLPEAKGIIALRNAVLERARTGDSRRQGLTISSSNESRLSVASSFAERDALCGVGGCGRNGTATSECHIHAGRPRNWWF